MCCCCWRYCFVAVAVVCGCADAAVKSGAVVTALAMSALFVGVVQLLVWI